MPFREKKKHFRKDCCRAEILSEGKAAWWLLPCQRVGSRAEKGEVLVAPKEGSLLPYSTRAAAVMLWGL